MRGCGNFSLVGVSGSECCVVGMRCKRWSCQYCGARKVRSTVARIRAGMRLGSCRFFTLTAPGDEDPEDSLAEFAARWKRFRMRLERRFGRIEYLGVVELQKRGSPHIHVVYRGPFIPQAWLSRAAAESGFGKIADIRRSNPNLSRYLAKYLAKDLTAAGADGAEPVKLPPYFRRVRWSRNWCVWEKRKRHPRWRDWWIADAVPAHAAIDAARRGLTVREVVADNWAARFELRRPVRWLRSLVGYRPHAPLSQGAV